MRVFLLHIALPLAIPRLVNCKRYSSRLDDNGRDLITSDFISSSYGHFNVTFLQCGIFPIPTVSSRTQTQNSWGYQLSEKNPRITEVRVVQRRVVSRSDCSMRVLTSSSNWITFSVITTIVTIAHDCLQIDLKLSFMIVLDHISLLKVIL